ncbi:MAG: PQQ-binding-like beta-propeller repeat protein [Pontiellaceae bacterium]|nr:PQQ-binding-like beta-propeller repeat protein [Pontiellaceae bacterium]MBN2785599.1 PQQ-binding-like beta-propeller repeat protein [Pontiellaceae bacterium]
MAVKSDFKQRSLPAAIMQSLAWVSALFSLIICILLISDHVRLLQMDPLNDPVLLELRSRLADHPENREALIEQIRTYDLYARRAFFSSAEQRRTGGLLLCGGALVCFLCFKLSRYFMPRKPTAGIHEPTDHHEMNALFRQLMAGTGVFLVVVSLFLSFSVRSDLSAVLARFDPVAADLDVKEDHSSVGSLSGLPESFFGNWPSLRGPGNIGHAGTEEFPLSWDMASGAGVLWTAAVPVHGFNSPVAWNDRIFMTGADEEGQEVFCFDAGNGELLWTRSVKTGGELPEVSPDTGFAAPTMATDGVRVYAIFATGELAAFDMDGNAAWQLNIGCPENPYGMGSSLITDATRLYVQYDHADRQCVMAFDGASGELIWETPREHISWSSPALIEIGTKTLLILNDEQNVTAYDPATGAALWQVECLGGEVAPSPAFNGADILFVGNEYAQATALRLSDDGAAILWQYDEYLPEISSPLATPERIYIATSAGDIVCLDAGSGEVRWEQEFDEGFNASPVLAGGRIYAVDLSGIMHVFDDADVYHSIADIEMGEAVYATPAFINGRIIVRGENNLFCIGQK